MKNHSFAIELTMAIVFGLSQITLAAPSDQPGHPGAKEFVDWVEGEVDGCLNRIASLDAWQNYHDYVDKLMGNSAGDRTWSDKTGNCRLKWVDRLLRHPMRGIAEAEKFTAEVHDAAQDADEWGKLINISARVLDTPGNFRRTATRPNTVTQGMALVRQCLSRADRAVGNAFRSLRREDRELLRDQLYTISTGQVERGSRFADQAIGRQITDALERVQRRSLHEAAAALVPLTDRRLHEMFYRLQEQDRTIEVEGIGGGVRQIIQMKEGLIVVGDENANSYDLDAMANVICVIDLGGNDIYREGTLTDNRRVLAILDLDGDDTYTGTEPGIQGGAILGVSLLYDDAGDDKYEAQDVSQGSTLAGAGILIDRAGNDSYTGLRRTQGQAICGLGILLDRNGNDHYRAALLAQGVGGPLGFGLLDDLDGNDEYYAGGLYPPDYEDTPGHSGWSQGIGVGPRGVANGGIGVLLDGGGDDLYECDYFSHAGGYWFAAGFARDFGGNDQRIGATRTAYYGGERQPPRFTRWGIAFGCHFAVGYLFDDAGNDVYHGETTGVAFAWDFGVTALYDFAGNDQYDMSGGGSGSASEAGVAILFDAQGNDNYTSSSHGSGDAKIDYHPVPDAGGNFAFAIDYGGTDQYAGGFSNDAVTERGVTKRKHEGVNYGFIIDRPQLPQRRELGRDPATTITEPTSDM